VLEVDRQPVRLLDLPADDHRQLRGGDREPLVTAARAHGERAGRAPGELDGRRDGGLRGLFDPPGAADPDDAGHVSGAGRDLVNRGRVLGLGAVLAGHADQHDALAVQDLRRHPGVSHRVLDVALLQPLELLPVVPLEDNLAELQQNARLARCLPPGLLSRLLGSPGDRDRIGNGHPPSLPHFLGVHPIPGPLPAGSSGQPQGFSGGIPHCARSRRVITCDRELGRA
jgi:hypothetical protein